MADVPGAPEGMYDFDLSADETAWAVEVTATTNANRKRVTAGIRSNGITSVPIEGHTTWVVGLHDDAQVKGIAVQLPAVLGEMSARGQLRLSDHDDFADPLVRALDQLRVQSVYGMEGTGEAKILLQPAAFGGWGWQGPEVDSWFSEWLQGDQAANKLRKLARSPDRKMLVIVLDSFSQPGLGIPLGLSTRLERGADYVMPTVSPPPELSALWLLPDTLSGEGLAWREGRGWSVLPPYKDRPGLMDGARW